jgi:dolichyl-diphosphooligosaccharide--protein glycosyltransferase
MILPVFLGLSLAFPMYALGRCWGGAAMALAATFVALISRYFMMQSRVGWYDTDPLNVPLVMAICLFSLLFARERGRARYRYLAAALACSGMLAWWWHTIPALTVFFAGVPLAVAFAFYYRPPRKEALVVYGILACIAAPVLLWRGPGLVGTVGSLYADAFGTGATVFPPAHARTTEQIGVTFAELAAWSIGSQAGFVVAALGLGLLVWRRRLECLFVAAPLTVALLSVEARRYLIWWAPLVGLGVGAVADALWRGRHRHWALGLCAPLVVLAVWWPNVGRMEADRRAGPVRSPYHFEAMKSLATMAPEDAIVWANWGHGYPLAYYSRRGVFADGGVHTGMHLYAGSFPLAVGDPRLAANWMQFYGVHGMGGLREMHGLFGEDWERALEALREILAAGPEEGARLVAQHAAFADGGAERWLPFFFPRQPRPAYLFLDVDKILSSWFRYGTWSTKTREGQRAVLMTFRNVRARGNTLTSGSTLSIDVEKGTARVRHQRYPLKELVVIRRGRRPDDVTRERRTYEARGGMIFWLIDGVGFGALMDDRAAHTMMARLFCGLDPDPRYFRSVKMSLPLYQIWEVTGDRIGAGD